MRLTEKQKSYISRRINELLQENHSVVSCREVFATPIGLACLSVDAKALMTYALSTDDSRISLIFPYKKAPVTGGLLYRLSEAAIVSEGEDEDYV